MGSRVTVQEDDGRPLASVPHTQRRAGAAVDPVEREAVEERQRTRGAPAVLGAIRGYEEGQGA
jgi:hypothetical protein